MYLGYVKALTVGNKLNCIIFWNTASTYQTCRIQCLAIKKYHDGYFHLCYSIPVFPNTYQL